MFFVLSKTLTYLMMPLFLVCASLLVSVLLKNAKWKRRFFWAGFVMLFFFSNEFIANAVMHAWEIPTIPYNKMRKHKLAIVLTSSTFPQWPNDRVYFSRAVDRVLHTVQLYKLGLVEKILISGGSGRLIEASESESLQFKKVMVLTGIPEQDIMIEGETRNTYESAVKVKQMLVQQGYVDTDCLLVTSAFHMRRSLACYHKAGLQVDNFTTDFYAHPPEYYVDTFIVPKVEAFDIWSRLIREWVGFAAYKAAGYI